MAREVDPETADLEIENGRAVRVDHRARRDGPDDTEE